MPALWRVAILAIAVVQFLVVHGAVWRRQFDWDTSILWSYATIPVFVAIALAIRKNLRAGPLLLHTIEIASYKFAITAMFLMGVLIDMGPADKQYKPSLPEVHFDPARTSSTADDPPARPPTPIDPRDTAEVEGVVRGADGTPVEGVLVYVSSGLDTYAFARPSEPLSIEAGGAFRPSPAIARVGQPIVVQSSDHELHTVLIRHRDQSWVAHVPVLASGAPRELDLHGQRGVFVMTCQVHRGKEADGWLLRVDHPFAVVTGPGGAFHLAGVPAVEVEITAFSPPTASTAQRVKLEPAHSRKVDLSLDAR